MIRKGCLTLTLTSTLIGMLTPMALYAEMVVAPHCLIKGNEAAYHILATQKGMDLISTDEVGIENLSQAKEEKRCGGFIDVTQDWLHFKTPAPDKHAAFLAKELQSVTLMPPPIYQIRYQTQVNQAISKMVPEHLWSDLTTYSAFYDRYYKTDNGLKAAQWIRDQVRAIAGTRTDVSMYFVPTVTSTGTAKQPSLVVKFGTGTGPGIVIGGHMDTTSPNTVKPGADDDGTGTVTVLETARVLLNSGMHFKKPIYFIWYAAEEVGLVGSQNVVKDFKAKGIPVSEVMQLDMTGYPDATYPTAMWMMDDYTGQALTSFMELMIKTYIPNTLVKHDSCGYGCSDHATWYRNGYNAGIAFEASLRTYNPNIHTSRDTIEKLTLSHMAKYAKLALAFAIELAEPV